MAGGWWLVAGGRWPVVGERGVVGGGRASRASAPRPPSGHHAVVPAAVSGALGSPRRASCGRTGPG
ncbi:hypothetical protein DN051_23805 [Streptomyces cadmiisoli]|uniref:Uncharacterized protein n=1 Tax=Streptomyces cadmiisoli TaxID=2184053 RepID=A0A2Z4J2K8_9ACTN|nr:hypothetical protein DN051_23805 [Streptomyces cadmiisoli]